MSTKPNAEGTPGSSSEPASLDGSGGGAETHQGGPTGVSAVSDTLPLSDDLSKAYGGFDASVHAMKDGKPVMLKGGGFARKRGRKAGATGATSGSQVAPSVNGANPSVTMTSEQASIMLLAVTQAICCTAFQDDAWKMDKQEFTANQAGLKAYLDSTGGMQLSPGWAVAAMGVTYAAPRLESPPTKNRLQKFAGWLAAKFKRG